MNMRMRTPSPSLVSIYIIFICSAAVVVFFAITPIPESATAHRSLRNPQSVMFKSESSVSVSSALADEHDSDRFYDEKSVPLPPVYTYDCPDNKDLSLYLRKGINPDGANRLSFLSGALDTVSEALASHRGKKIVLIGDSVMHQIYLSLSCMSHSAGAWESDNSFVGDRRVWLKNDSQIIFSNWGGNLLQFDWPKRKYDQPPLDAYDPFYDNTDWIDACEKREPFQQVTYNKNANPNILSSQTKNDHSFEEKVVLTRDDNVFIYGTLHNRGSHRIENMQRLNHLFHCMEEARALNEDPGWPVFTYIATPPQHFPGHEDGRWSGSIVDLTLTCRKEVNLSENQFHEEDKQLEGKVPMIGRDLGTSSMGEFHMGPRRTGVLDCTHWSMPGVPDLYAQAIMKSIDSKSSSLLQSLMTWLQRSLPLWRRQGA